jgi:hypothetical protein
MVRSRSRLIGCSVILVAAFGLADGIPTTEPLAYSGVLLNSVGAPVTSGVNVRLSLFDDRTGNLATNKKCETLTQSVTPDSQGRFSVVLDPTCLPAVKANPNLWVQVEVNGALLPRSKLTAVPYAVEADRAAVAASASGALALQVVPVGAVMAFNLAACPAGWTALTTAAGRTIIGVNAGANGLSARALGATVGEERHTMTVPELPSHDHQLWLREYSASSGPGGFWTVNWQLAGLTTGSGNGNPPLYGAGFQNAMTVQPTGSGTPANVMQPSLALLYCQKS